MALEAVAAVATIVSVPLAAAPIVTLKQKSRVRACIEDAELTLKDVTDNANLIPHSVLKNFVGICQTYIQMRNEYLEKRASGEYGGFQWPTTMLEARQAKNELLKRATLTAHQGKRITSNARHAKNRCSVDHGDTYLDGKGRCTICFPAELQHTNDGEISEDVSNPDSYVAEWYAMINSLKKSTLLPVHTASSGGLGNSTSPSVSSETQPHGINEMCPPQYDEIGNSNNGGSIQNSREVNATELSNLVGIYNSDCPRYISSHLPYPEENNAWKSLADLRDLLRGNGLRHS